MSMDIDEALIRRVMERYDFRSKREAVESALRHLDVEPATREEILAMEGMGWDRDLDEMRTTPEPVRRWIERE